MTLIKAGNKRDSFIDGSDNVSAGRDHLHRLCGPERLTGLGFRWWLAGYQSGAINSWEQAWNAYATELGPQASRIAIRDLSCWVRAVHGHARREIDLRPPHCDWFGHDECLAVSMIAAAQHNCPGLRACAFALLGAQPLDDVLDNAIRFAAVLRDNRLVLSQGSLVEPLAGLADGSDAPAH